MPIRIVGPGLILYPCNMPPADTVVGGEVHTDDNPAVFRYDKVEPVINAFTAYALIVIEAQFTFTGWVSRPGRRHRAFSLDRAQILI